MTRGLRIACLAAGLALAGAPHGGARADNIYPLAFGMTPQQAADALGCALVRVSGGRSSEILVTVRDAAIPSFFPGDEQVFLQFRGGRLTGWKKDWRIRHGQLF